MEFKAVNDKLGKKISAVEWINDLLLIARDDLGLDQKSAEDMARAIFDGLRRRAGGQERWIPAPNRRAGNETILADFNGRNQKEVCRMHKISKSQFYKILRAQITQS